MQSDYSITVRDLIKQFGKFAAVDNISFNVKKGEVFGFLGPNGAGKTTTIRILCGLLFQTSGEIFIEGYNIRNDVEKIKNIIGYMSQKFSLYTDLTVLENIKFYGGIYEVKDLNEKADEVIGLLNIKEFRNKLTQEIPAGIRQRVALAASFIHKPKILFLDEPTAGVDPILRKKFWDIIKNLAQDGTTIIVTTHYMDEAENCDRITLLNQGRIVDIGGVEEIKERFKKGNIIYIELEDNYVSNFEKIKKIDIPVKDISLHGSVVHLIQEIGIDDAKKQIKAFCKKTNIKYKDIFEDKPSLEDVFINLVKKMDSNGKSAAH